MLQSLCTTSPFWVTWLLQRNLGAAIDLAQLINLFWRWFARHFMSPTPRQEIEWTAPDWFDYASYYNYFLFYATVSLCYATVQPLVLPVTTLYFVLDVPLKKYLLLYVYITKTESGGQLWNIVFNRFLIATLLANLVAALVVKGGWPNFIGQGATGWIMVAAMAPLPFLLLGFKLYCRRAFADQCKYYHLALPAANPEDGPAAAHANAKPGAGPHGSRRHERVGVKFGHPALYAPLVTPMVHARAEHALAEIYSGRTAASDARASHYGYGAEYDLDPMSGTHPGKREQQASAQGMFEVVPEHELDFGYFKDRPEFAVEHGGRGELFGRPADLVSERGATPRPFTPGSTTVGDAASLRSRTPSVPRGMAPGMARQGSGDGIRQPQPQRPARRPLPQQQQQGLYGMPQANDSRRGLLGQAGPMAHEHSRSRSPSDGGSSGGGGPTPAGEQPPYGLDRWRGRGYFGVSGQADEDVGYAPYRPAAHPGAGGGVGY